MLSRVRRESDIARFSRHAEIMDSSKLCARWQWPLETCDLVGWGWSCNITAIYQRLRTRFTPPPTGSGKVRQHFDLWVFKWCLLKWFCHGHFELNLKGHGLNFHVLESSSQTFAVICVGPSKLHGSSMFQDILSKKPRVLTLKCTCPSIWIFDDIPSLVDDTWGRVVWWWPCLWRPNNTRRVSGWAPFTLWMGS